MKKYIKLVAVLIVAAFLIVGLSPIIMRKEVCVNERWYKTADTSKLEIYHCTARSIKNLKYFTSLKWLLVFPEKRINSVDFLSEMGELQTLFLYNCDVKDWSKLQNCKKLQYFYAYNSGIDNFQVLGNMPQLEELVINISIPNSKVITDFSGIENLKSLKLLTVCCNVSDISPIGECKSLTHLSIRTSDNSIDLTQLKQLNNLEELEIWNRNRESKEMSLKGISELNNVSKITLLDISSNDFDIFLDMENLKKLHLYDCTISDEIIQALREKNVSFEIN